MSVARKTITLSRDLWEAISAYRHEHRIPSEIEAIRRLLQAALERAAAAKKGRK